MTYKEMYIATLLSTQHSGGGNHELVNFEKRRKEFQILAQLTLYQKSASLYAFPHNPQLVQWLRHAAVLSHQQRSVLHLSLYTGINICRGVCLLLNWAS